jgi:hypothetical protein
MADDAKAIVFQGCRKVQYLVILFLAWFVGPFNFWGFLCEAEMWFTLRREYM